MDGTHIYAIGVASLVFCLLLRSAWPSIALYLCPTYSRVSRYLTFSYILRRHTLVGPWSAIVVLLEMTYLTVNLVPLVLGASDWVQVGRRAGTLSIINLAPLLSGLHLGALADWLRLPLEVVRTVHRSASIMVLGLVMLHILVAAVSEKATFQRESLKPFALIVRCFLSCETRILIVFRLLQHCVCSLSYHNVWYRSYPMNSSFDLIRRSPWSPRIRFGDICRQRKNFLVCFSTSSADCSALPSLGKLH